MSFGRVGRNGRERRAAGRLVIALALAGVLLATGPAAAPAPAAMAAPAASVVCKL